MMSDSLFASARVVPARSAARVGSSPMAPVMPLTTTSAGRAANAELASGPVNSSGSYAAELGWPAHGSVGAWSGSVGCAPDRRGQLVGGGVRRGDDRDLKGDGLLREELEVATRGQAHHLEAVGVAPDEVEGLGPDGAGRAEQDDPAGPAWRGRGSERIGHALILAHAD